MAKTSARTSLLALARLPLPSALARVVRSVLSAPVQSFAQDAWRRVLRDFPLVAELLELSRVVRESSRASATNGAPSEYSAASSDGPESESVAASGSGSGSGSASGTGTGSGSGSGTGLGSGLTPSPALEPDLPLDALLAELRGPSAEAAAVAVERLALSDDPRARAALLAAVRNQDGHLHPLPRVAALRALASAAGGPAREAIVAAVSGVSAELSLAAIAALVQYAPQHAADPIRAVVDDRTGYFAPEVRAAAESALRQLGDRIVPGQN